MAGTLVQTKDGATDNTTITVTLDSTPTSGNLLYIGVSWDKSISSPITPTGFSIVESAYLSSSVSGVVYWKESDATETSITISWTTSRTVEVWYAEYSGVNDLDVSSSDDSGASSVTSQTTGVTSTTTDADARAIATFGSDTFTNTQDDRTYSTGYTEQRIGTIENGLMVADKDLSSTGTQECVFTCIDSGDQMFGILGVFNLASSEAVVLTGTMTATVDEDDITTGGKTIIMTLTGDTFKAAGTGPIGSTADTQALIDGFDAASSPTNGWNNEVRDKAATTEVVRTSSTVATWTVAAQSGYDISSQETITGTIPTDVLVTGAGAITATPTFTVDQVAAGASIPIFNKHYRNQGMM